MTVRIPSSLKWLINRHARLLSEISRVEKELCENQKAHRQLLQENKKIEAVSSSNLDARKAYLQQLRTDIKAIDSTLLLHDIPINPEIIKPLKTQSSPRLLQFGEMTRLIFSCLKFAGGEFRLTSEIFAFVITNCRRKLTEDEQKYLRFRLGKRLVALRSKGLIKNVNQAKSNYEGRWELANWTPVRNGRPRKTLQMHNQANCKPKS